MSIQILNSGLQIEADAIATLALAALLLLLGAAVKNRVRILNHYCIPAPVVGGFLFMFLTFLGHVTGSFQVSFDTYFQSPFMLAFFTTVGLSASFSLLKRGGIMLVVYWLISGVISVIQNAIGIAVGTAIGLPAPYALLSSAISMIGGHGAAASYGAQFTEMGYDQAMLVGAAAATFGLITAVMIGGPLGSRLIERYKLTPDRDDSFAERAHHHGKCHGAFGLHGGRREGFGADRRCHRHVVSDLCRRDVRRGACAQPERESPVFQL